jgi:hypothetical protein
VGWNIPGIDSLFQEEKLCRDLNHSSSPVLPWRRTSIAIEKTNLWNLHGVSLLERDTQYQQCSFSQDDHYELDLNEKKTNDSDQLRIDWSKRNRETRNQKHNSKNRAGQKDTLLTQSPLDMSERIGPRVIVVSHCCVFSTMYSPQQLDIACKRIV